MRRIKYCKDWTQMSEGYAENVAVYLFHSMMFDRSAEERQELRERAQVCKSMAHLTAHFAEMSRMSKGQPP